MINRRFFSAFVGGIFSITLLVNCFPKSVVASPITSIEQAVTTLESTLDKADLYNGKTAIALKQRLASKPANTFTEEELQAIIKTILGYGSSIPQEVRSTLNEVFSFVSSRLSQYKVSGVAFACDPNAGLIWDTQNPDFTVIFKDENGKTKSRKFDALINSIGLKLAFSINIDAIFILGDIDFNNSNQVLELGTGIDGAIPIPLPLSPFITYAPFINAPGAILIVGVPLLGINGGLSLVTGGTLTPRNS